MQTSDSRKTHGMLLESAKRAHGKRSQSNGPSPGSAHTVSLRKKTSNAAMQRARADPADRCFSHKKYFSRDKKKCLIGRKHHHKTSQFSFFENPMLYS
jgi:hypothetical protein